MNPDAGSTGGSYDYGGGTATDDVNSATAPTPGSSSSGNDINSIIASLIGAGGGGSYGGGSRAAAYEVGGGKTKYDEFVQQMQLERDKLAQAQAIENQRLAQEKELTEAKLAEEQKIADQNTVEAFTKQLMGMQGPKDPYGYLFSSRGLAAPRGYAPEALPLPPAVVQAYKDQGVDLASAQAQLSGDQGPSFINGMLGSMPTVLQQGPMGFQNAPQNPNLLLSGASGEAKDQAGINAQVGLPTKGQAADAFTQNIAGQLPPVPVQGPDQRPGQPNMSAQQTPIGMAAGGTIPGFASDSDVVGFINRFASGGVVSTGGTTDTPMMAGAAPPGAAFAAAQADTAKDIIKDSNNLGLPNGTMFVGGGNVPGYAPGRDTVPAMLSPGEGVLTPQATQALGGPAAINAINSGVRPQGMAQGGVITPDVTNNISSGIGGWSPTMWLHTAPTADSPVGYQLPTGQSLTATGQPVTGGDFSEIQQGQTIQGNQWIPINYNGQILYAFAPEAKQSTGYTIAGQPVGQNTVENAPPPGWTMTAPGVATQNPPSPMPAQQAPQTWAPAIGGPMSPQQPTAASWGAGPAQPLGQTPSPMPAQQGTPPAPPAWGAGGPAAPLGAPAGPLPGQSAPGPNPAANPNSPLLTGGILTPPAPAGGSPMNLNMLDPYTRSLVDQYGRPQVPSLQAWNAMPQSGKDAYSNYVEKVAGGNMQDLLDQMKSIYSGAGSLPQGQQFT